MTQPEITVFPISYTFYYEVCDELDSDLFDDSDDASDLVSDDNESVASRRVRQLCSVYR